MKNVARLLWIAVAIELLAAGLLAFRWWSEPQPPRPDLSHFHPATAGALRALEQQVVDTGKADDWLELGKAYLRFGLFPEAEYCCAQAIRVDAGSFAAYYWRAVAFNQLGESERAIETFRLALPLAENESQMSNPAKRCWYGIGRNYLRQEKGKQAEEAFRKGGDFAPTQLQLARLFLQTNRQTEAAAILSKLIARSRDDSVYYQLRARARERLGDDAGAFDDRMRVERASGRVRTDAIIEQLQNLPDAIGLYAELRECDRLRQTDPATAVTRLRALLADGWRSETVELLIEAEMRIGNAQQAIELLRKREKREGTTALLLARMAVANDMLRKGDRAFELRKRAVLLKPTASTYSALKRNYEQRGDFALARLQRAYELTSRGVSQYRKNKPADAVSYLKQAVDLQPDIADAWYYLGECQRVLGDKNAAVNALQKCLEVNPNHGRALMVLQYLSNLELD